MLYKNGYNCYNYKVNSKNSQERKNDYEKSFIYHSRRCYVSFSDARSSRIRG